MQFEKYRFFKNKTMERVGEGEFSGKKQGSEAEVFLKIEPVKNERSRRKSLEENNNNNNSNAIDV